MLFFSLVLIFFKAVSQLIISSNLENKIREMRNHLQLKGFGLPFAKSPKPIFHLSLYKVGTITELRISAKYCFGYKCP